MEIKKHQRMSDRHLGSRRFDPMDQQHYLVEIGHEIISMAVLFLPVFHVGPLSVTGERTASTKGQSLPRKSLVRLTDRLDLTIVVKWDIKKQDKQTSETKEERSGPAG